PLEQQDGVYEVSTELLLTAFEPIAIREAKTWLTWRDDGLLALSRVCPFEPGIFQQVKIGVNNRFECPSCGSKFKFDGTFIEGPAPRGLDRYGLWIRTPEGRLIASEGEPIAVDDAVQIFIDTTVRIPGQ